MVEEGSEEEEKINETDENQAGRVKLDNEKKEILNIALQLYSSAGAMIAFFAGFILVLITIILFDETDVSEFNVMIVSILAISYVCLTTGWLLYHYIIIKMIKKLTEVTIEENVEGTIKKKTYSLFSENLKEGLDFESRFTKISGKKLKFLADFLAKGVGIILVTFLLFLLIAYNTSNIIGNIAAFVLFIGFVLQCIIVAEILADL